MWGTFRTQIECEVKEEIRRDRLRNPADLDLRCCYILGEMEADCVVIQRRGLI